MDDEELGSMDDELEAELRAAVGLSMSDQMSAQLTDLADVLGLYLARLFNNGFTKQDAREMSREWYTRYLWGQQALVCDCDEE